MKNYCCLPKRHPLAPIKAMRINISALKSYFGNLFWTLFYDPDQCATVQRKIPPSALSMLQPIKAQLFSDWLRYEHFWNFNCKVVRGYNGNDIDVLVFTCIFRWPDWLIVNSMSKIALLIFCSPGLTTNSETSNPELSRFFMTKKSIIKKIVKIWTSLLGPVSKI